MTLNQYQFASFRGAQGLSDFLNSNEISRSRILQIGQRGELYDLIYENDNRYFIGEVVTGPNIRPVIAGMGQSYFQAVDAGNRGPILSVGTQPYANQLLAAGPALGAMIDTAETPLTVAINEMASRLPPSLRNLIRSNHALGGTTLASVFPGGASAANTYNLVVADLVNSQTLLTNGAEPLLGALMTSAYGYTEILADNSEATALSIMSELMRLRNVLENDAVLSTGQGKGVPLFHAQFGWQGSNTTPIFGWMAQVASQQYLQQPGMFCVGATYHHSIDPGDNVHMYNICYQTLGELYGMVAYLVMYKNIDWVPLHINTVTIDPADSTRLIVDVFCPALAYGYETSSEAPLILDTDATLFGSRATPTAVNVINTPASATHHGFVYTGSGQAVTGVSYGGRSSSTSAFLYVQLDGPASQGDTLDYAITGGRSPANPRGNVRDNFNWVTRTGRTMKNFLMSGRYTVT